MTAPDAPPPADGPAGPAGPGPRPAAGTAREPRPVAEIDDGIFDALRPLHRIRWFLLTGVGLVLAAATITLAFLYAGDHGQLHADKRLVAAQQAELARQDAAIKASCRFWGALTALPAAPTPPAVRPSRVLIVLIASGRDAFGGEGCGQLPPQSADLRKWAAVYKVPLR